MIKKPLKAFGAPRCPRVLISKSNKVPQETSVKIKSHSSKMSFRGSCKSDNKLIKLIISFEPCSEGLNL